MKKRRSINPLFIVIAITVVIAVVITMLNLFGINTFQTLSGMTEGKGNSFNSVSLLESGKAYVWHHKGGNIEDDLEGVANEDVFFTCITGDYNFKNKEKEEELDYPRSIWVSSSEDADIPTVTTGDYLIYVSDTEVPDGIIFERFADYGYTIGISNLIKDGSGHYYIDFSDTDEDDYKYFVDMNSDASQVVDLDPITRLYLDKAGDVKVREDSVSDGGTVLGLKKDKSYVCQFYTGTYYQDFKMTANIHSFSSMERFISYDYEFMHSNFIVITIPDYFKSGYYFVNGVGLVRYVSDADAKSYNGKAYDDGIDWNDPIILYNEDVTVKYDPSDPDFEEKQIEEHSDPGVDEEEIEIENNSE